MYFGVKTVEFVLCSDVILFSSMNITEWKWHLQCLLVNCTDNEFIYRYMHTYIYMHVNMHTRTHTHTHTWVNLKVIPSLYLHGNYKDRKNTITQFGRTNSHLQNIIFSSIVTTDLHRWSSKDTPNDVIVVHTYLERGSSFILLSPLLIHITHDLSVLTATLRSP